MIIGGRISHHESFVRLRLPEVVVNKVNYDIMNPTCGKPNKTTKKKTNPDDKSKGLVVPYVAGLTKRVSRVCFASMDFLQQVNLTRC